MAWGDVASGAGTGATIGSAFGPWGTAIGGLAGGALGGIFGRKKSDETKIQKTQRQLIDELLGSLHGEGPYSNLFTANEADFERGFAEPARARFRNITAPQIQQRYIANGLQNSTGLEDTLTRAGVDMDALINQEYLNYMQGAQNRQANAIGQILGQSAGASPGQSIGSAALEGIGGYLSSPSFGKNIEDILGTFNKKNEGQSESIEDTFLPARKGFEKDPFVYDPYTGVQTGGY